MPFCKQIDFQCGHITTAIGRDTSKYPTCSTVSRNVRAELSKWEIGLSPLDGLAVPKR